MTVISNPLLHGIPVIIGDTVIRTKEPCAKSIEVPTVLQLPELERPISRFCRKVYIVDKRLAIAWTGNTSEAEAAILALKAHIRHEGVSERALADFFQTLTGCRELALLGWIADPKKEPRPFCWSTNDSAGLVFDEHDLVEGTGTPLFWKAFRTGGQFETGGGLSSYEVAAVTALSGIARLLTLETETGLPLTQGFGFCYDVAVWCGYRFKYVPSYTQLNIDFTFDTRKNGGQFKFRPLFLTYNSLGQCAAFAVVRHSPKQNADLSFSMSGARPVRIPPLWTVDDAVPSTLSTHSDFVCAFLHIVDELNRLIVAPFCITRDAKPGDGMWLSRQGRLELLHFNTGVVANLHRAALASLARRAG